MSDAPLIYLDSAATAPMRKGALEAAWPFLTGEFGNPSSHHSIGERAAAALTDARRTVARILGGRAGDIVFTSGGTEGDNLAIKGLALANPRGRHLITTRIEHEAVLESVEYLRRSHDFEVTYLPVSPEGRVSVAALEEAIRPQTTLVTIALANNEIGTIQDIAALAEVAHAHGALFHTDAVQAAGWLELNAKKLGVDALTISGHKVGAGKGIGAAYIRGRLPLEPVLHGGGQERERRSGTENMAGIVALASALSAAESEREQRAAQVAAWRDDFISQVQELVPAALLTGPSEPDERLANNASFCFPGVMGETVLLELERRGIVCSSGSACAAGSDEPSHVLLACGIDPAIAQASVRFTIGEHITPAHLDAAATAVSQAVAAIRGI